MQSNSNKLSLFLIILLIFLVACGTPGDTNTGQNSNNNENNSLNNNVSVDNMETDENSSVNTPNDSPAEGENTTSERNDFELTSIPIMDNATNIVFGDDGVVSYQTQYSTEEILAFYKTEMANLGFTPGYEIAVGDKIVARFEKGDLPIVLSTTADGSGGFFVLVGIVDE